MEFNKKTYETVISGLTKKISESEEILKTYNHDIFKKMRGNREINERHVAKLKKSILENYIPNAIIVKIGRAHV